MRRLLWLALALALATPVAAQENASGGSTSAEGATGVAVPGRAGYLGLRDNGNLVGALQCDKIAAITAAAAATTQIIALSGSTVIYVCGFTVSGAGAAGTLVWKYGTGVACATGPVSLSGAQATAIGGAISLMASPGYIFKTVAGQALCITMATAAATAAGFVVYAQF